MAKQLLVFGGSGHAKDVICAARALGYEQFKIVTTDGSCHIAGLSALKESDLDPDRHKEWDCIAAIGDNGHRQRFFETYSRAMHFVSIISPEAFVAPSSQVGPGSFVGAFAYLGPDSVLGEACIVNTHSIVGHDTVVGKFSHVGPRVCLSGHVELGDRVLVGAGASFNNGSYDRPLTVPDDVTIGMGCLITESIRHKGIRLIPKPNYIATRE